MVETEIYKEEPVGPPQENFGAHVVETCTSAALDHFIEAKNAAMGPLLNPQGIAALFSADALLEVDLPDGSQRKCRGRAEIEGFFTEFAAIILSVVLEETRRVVAGRSAVWFGHAHGVLAQDRTRQELEARLEVVFDEEDHVVHERARFAFADPH